MKKLGLALMALMLSSGMGAGAVLAEGAATQPANMTATTGTTTGAASTIYTGTGAGMTGTGLGTVGTTPAAPSGVANYGRVYTSPLPVVSPTPFTTPTPIVTPVPGNYGATGTYNTYGRPYGTNPYGTGIRTNTYRVRTTAANAGNWGWLGLLGLFGLAGLRNRNERPVDDRSRDKI